MLPSRDHVLALVAKDLKSFVEDRSQLREDRATTNATAFVVLDLRLWDAHSIHFPIDVSSIR
jgi:phosphatidylserine decarboxylase